MAARSIDGAPSSQLSKIASTSIRFYNCIMASMKPSNPNPLSEAYIFVDVETSGPSPSRNALLSIGACTNGQLNQSFYVELQPDSEDFEPEAMKTHNLSLETLKKSGLPPEAALSAFRDWICQVVPTGQAPVFTAFNAPFDWMFVSEYFYKYLGHNPFGHKALDVKAYYMGQQGVLWGDTAYDTIRQSLGMENPLTHNALQDAVDLAELFERLIT